MAELVDALVSGTSERKFVRVRAPLRVQIRGKWYFPRILISIEKKLSIVHWRNKNNVEYIIEYLSTKQSMFWKINKPRSWIEVTPKNWTG